MPILQRMQRAWRALTGPQPVAPGRRNFAGAAISRLTASLATFDTAVNADLDGTLVILRARARGLVQNHEYGRRALTLIGNNVIGAYGPVLQVRAKQDVREGLDTVANSAIESHWAKWSTQCDARGQCDLAHLERLAIKGVARDGETLVRLVRGPNLPYGLQLQFLEADRLYEALNQLLPNGNVIRQGVESNSVGRPVAYHLRSAHPGENYYNKGTPLQIERVPAKDILHLFMPERFEQVRGYTWFHAVLMRATMLQGYEEAAVVAARVGAAKMGVFKRADNAMPTPLGEGMAEGKDESGNFQISAEAGEFFELPPGYELQSWNPDYPHQNFESFMTQCLRGMAAGLDVAAHNLTGNMNDVNYSSARIAELSERDSWMVMQCWFIHSFCKRVYEEWLAGALLGGWITFPNGGKSMPADKYQKFVEAASFQGRRWSWIDPMKEVGAAIEAINARLKSRTGIVAETGADFEDLVNEIAAEQKIADKAGVVLPDVQPKAAGVVDTGEDPTLAKPKKKSANGSEQSILKVDLPSLKTNFESIKENSQELREGVDSIAEEINSIKKVSSNIGVRVAHVANAQTSLAECFDLFRNSVSQTNSFILQSMQRQEHYISQLHQRGRADDNQEAAGRNQNNCLEMRESEALSPESVGGAEMHQNAGKGFEAAPDSGKTGASGKEKTGTSGGIIVDMAGKPESKD